jgi:plasmid maintenance system antidote protein VapI
MSLLFQTTPKTVGELVRLMLFAMDQGVREAGKELGCSPATVSRITREDYDISSRLLGRIRRWANVTADDMLSLVEAKT